MLSKPMRTAGALLRDGADFSAGNERRILGIISKLSFLRWSRSFRMARRKSAKKLTCQAASVSTYTADA
jgi:hypothetical protein